ncbi:MAG: copper amine oxidase N-terminal domain-containing protein [Clostridia bacterium]|nr:copper amine oxidase N-terminal domain-containing protein [Clostridia bacterium]
MKKKIALVLATVMSMSALAVSASAEDYTSVNLLIEGQAVETDQPAVIVDGRTMVPVRVVAEALGTTVDWDGETKTVIFEQDGLTASMVVGETVLNISDGEITYPVEIDTPAAIINDRTMVPIRFLSENFGFGVEWDAETKTVNVTAKKAELEDDVESSAAVEVEAKFNELDGYCGKINASAEVLDDADAEAYAGYCNVVATVGSVLGTADMDDEAEFEAALKALAEAEEGIKAIAEKLNVSLAE